MPRRLCLGCLEDWTRNPDLTVSLCPACEIEWELRDEANRKSYSIFNPDEIDWWGITVNDISPEDIQDGFYVSVIGDDDQSLNMREVYARQGTSGNDLSEYAK